uniref:Uncharacterized protein n=1 Tax=Meloidogyne enterolobii TaxID=390850 RepID=A0A6V7WMG0_MELEN|nr:unnamed protein product [Meloidogyne enterolobii]
MKEFKLVEDLKNSVPTNLPKKTIKETNLVEKFEKETDFDLPKELFEAKEENKFEEKSCYVSEEDQVEAETIEEIVFENMVQIAQEDEPVEKDFEELRQEKANELGRMKIDFDVCNQEYFWKLGRKTL